MFIGLSLKGNNIASLIIDNGTYYAHAQDVYTFWGPVPGGLIRTLVQKKNMMTSAFFL